MSFHLFVINVKDPLVSYTLLNTAGIPLMSTFSSRSEHSVFCLWDKKTLSYNIYINTVTAQQLVFTNPSLHDANMRD